MVISRPSSFSKWSRSSCNVISAAISNASQIWSNSLSLYLSFCDLIGSENPKNGNAKLMNPFLKSSMAFVGSKTLYNSKQTKPVTKAVVVAMAGMILPAMNFVLE